MRRRSSLRRQLTLLYAGPFLLSGAALLLIPFLGARQTSPVGEGPGAPEPHVVVEHASNAVPLMVVSFAVMVVIAVVLGYFIAGRFLRPIRLIVDTARDISATNLHRRLGPTGRRDELAELAGTLDDLFGRLEAAFAAQRRFVANAAHELRTPLTAQRTLLQVTMADPQVDRDELLAVAEEVLRLGESQARLIDSLLTLATGEQGLEHAVPLDLAEVVAGVLCIRPLEGPWVAGTLHEAPTTGDVDLIESLVSNLVENGARHNVERGTVDVSTGMVDGRATLVVENTGPVVPPDELDRLFQPFQRLGTQRVRTTKDGYGLGLAIVRAIANAHGADLTATPREGGGLRVTVTFR